MCYTAAHRSWKVGIGDWSAAHIKNCILKYIFKKIYYRNEIWTVHKFFGTIDIQFLLWVATYIELPSPLSKLFYIYVDLQTCNCCIWFYIIIYVYTYSRACVYRPTVHWLGCFFFLSSAASKSRGTTQFSLSFDMIEDEFVRLN